MNNLLLLRGRARRAGEASPDLQGWTNLRRRAACPTAAAGELRVCAGGGGRGAPHNIADRAEGRAGGGGGGVAPPIEYNFLESWYFERGGGIVGEPDKTKPGGTLKKSGVQFTRPNSV